MEEVLVIDIQAWFGPSPDLDIEDPWMLFHLKQPRFSFSSIEVHLVVISYCTHLYIQSFLTPQYWHFSGDSYMLTSLVREPAPAWDLNSVLLSLIEFPFEPFRMFHSPPHSELCLPSSCHFSQESEWASGADGWIPLHDIPFGQGNAETSPEVHSQDSLRFPANTVNLPVFFPKSDLALAEKKRHTHSVFPGFGLFLIVSKHSDCHPISF